MVILLFIVFQKDLYGSTDNAPKFSLCSQIYCISGRLTLFPYKYHTFIIHLGKNVFLLYIFKYLMKGVRSGCGILFYSPKKNNRIYRGSRYFSTNFHLRNETMSFQKNISIPDYSFPILCVLYD